MLARLAGMFATQIQAVVIGWQVYELTRSAMALAWVGLAQFLPMLLLLMPAGDLIDRVARKPVLMASWIVAMFCSLALLWLSGHGSAGVSGIYATLVLFGCTRAFSGPTVQSILPQIVPREQLAQAIATNGMVMRAASIGGPIVGGLLYAWGGGALSYAVCALSFLSAVFLLARVEIRYADMHPGASAADSTMWQRFTVGIRFIIQRRIILGSISLDLFAVLLGGVVALLPIYAAEILHTGSDGLGLLRAAIAFGEVGAGFVLSRYPFNRNVGKTMLIAVAVFGGANLVFSLSHWYWLSFAALMVAGAADMVSVYIRGALVQFSTPDDMRGRVSAVNMLFIGSSNELGEFRAGSFAEHLGVVAAAVSGGLCTLAVVAGWAWLFPTLRKVDKFEEAEGK
ncbi:membrane protein [Betaproteobacteria bacterium]|nr:membrane protein [Betaproteobacteria bacterium]GHU15813.1 membrane protein [Betaproteobacteria bacterium]